MGITHEADLANVRFSDWGFQVGESECVEMTYNGNRRLRISFSAESVRIQRIFDISPVY